MKYKVLVDFLDSAKKDQIIEAKDLVGCNIDALIIGGHITIIDTKIKNEVQLQTVED